MTATAGALPDSVPLGRDLLTRVRERRSTSDAAERDIMELAVEFAYANPALPGAEEWRPESLPVWFEPASTTDGDPADLDWFGLPSLRWDAPAAFAAANAMTTVAGKALLRDALLLKHRAPGVWAAMRSGLVSVRRARDVAQTLLGQHDDVCRYVDNELVARMTKDGARAVVGPVVAERLVDEAMLRMHAEERELDQVEALDRRHVTIDPASINHHGIADLEARADWADLAAFDETVARVAEAIKELPEHQHESLDARRSIALGILADPARAESILEGRLDARPSRVRELAAVLHLTEANVFQHDPVVLDADQKAHLEQTILAWAGRHDMALRVMPVRHCGGTAGGCADCPAEIDCDSHSRHALEDYTPSALDRRIVELNARRCAHPYCNRSARRCDYDHVVAFDKGGATCPKCNLAPLCRHHHRLKTHAGWRYWKLGPETYLWRDPHGLIYLRTRDGTRELD
jgi:hypothetical protein